MDWLVAHWSDITGVIGNVYLALLVIVNLTPTETDNKILGWVSSLARTFGPAVPGILDAFKKKG